MNLKRSAIFCIAALAAVAAAEAPTTKAAYG